MQSEGNMKTRQKQGKDMREKEEEGNWVRREDCKGKYWGGSVRGTGMRAYEGEDAIQ